MYKKRAARLSKNIPALPCIYLHCAISLSSTCMHLSKLTIARNFRRESQEVIIHTLFR